MLFGGTATVASIPYTAKVKAGEAAGLAADSQVWRGGGDANQGRGHIDHGSHQLHRRSQAARSAAPGGAPSIRGRTYFELEPSQYVGSVGSWEKRRALNRPVQAEVR
jgi:hypothetical protein